MKTISLKVPEGLDRELTALAEKKGTSKSDIVRELLSRLLRGEQGLAEGSFLSQAEDLAGSVSGPDDLSHDPRYLEGYGA